MFKVFLADDNELSRKAVKNSVSWKKSGCKIVDEAQNGLEALEKILEIKPDIALLDIKMPGLSGLEVAQKIKEEKLNCLVILITAYDDFAFAREGLKLGVFDYLLKPVSEEELQEVIKKAIEKLREQGKQTERFMSRKLLREGISGSETAAKALREELQEEWRFKEYCILLISSEENIGEAEFIELTKICESRLPIHLLDVWTQEGLAFLCIFQQVMLSRDYCLTALKAGNLIVNKLKAYGKTAVVSISETSEKTDDLQKLFKHAVFSKNSRFFLENQSVIHYDSLRSHSIQDDYKRMEYFGDFLADCRSGSEKIEQSLDRFLELLGADQSYDVEYIRNILIQTGIMMTYSLREKGIKNAEKSVNDIIRELSECPSIQKAFSWLRSYAKELSRVCLEKQKYSAQTKRILEYLNSNYKKHISLQDASDALKLSNAHICRLLKNDTGETFVTLLNKIRIREAIRLLREGELKVYEVADQVGFSNYAYFYQLFKKETGYSPSEFK